VFENAEESEVTLLPHTDPATSVCEDDLRSSDGAVILDTLKIHPFAVTGDSAVRNPFLVPPQESRITEKG